MGQITDFGDDLEKQDEQISRLQADVSQLTRAMSGLREQLDARQQTGVLLAGRMEDMQADMAGMGKKLDAITDTLAQARGGWRALMWLGSAIAGLLALVPFLRDHFKW
jgi:peptidoglycan hydrolase CwlO-like protein